MTATINTLDDLYAAFDGLSMEGGWHRRSPALWPEPRKTFLPMIWRYSEVKPRQISTTATKAETAPITCSWWPITTV